MENLKNLDHEYIANTYARFPVEIISGKGSIVVDQLGKKYIDLGSGIAVNTFGYADDVWAEAVTAQLSKVQHTSNLYYTEPCAMLAEKLCKRTGMKKVFFCNSGAEANECAIKVARKYAASKKGSECFTIITLKNSFHGRTLTTLAATGQDHFHEQFQPLTPGFLHCEANNLQEMDCLIQKNNVAGILIECIQGEGGVIPLDHEFVTGIADLAKKNDIILAIDEVQTGNGRSGNLYSYMNYGIIPDVISTAKGLGGGLPLGATILGEKVQNTLGLGDHGSTFGGNPVCCAGAISVLNRIDEELLEDIKSKSTFAFSYLSGKKGIVSVSGMGLIIGIETTRPAKDVVKDCIDLGVLCLTAKNKVRLLPALNIPTDLLKKGLEIIATCCAK